MRDAGPTSNLTADSSSKQEDNNKDFPTQLKAGLTPQKYRELFETLAEWNDVLENQLPLSQDPEEPQP